MACVYRTAGICCGPIDGRCTACWIPAGTACRDTINLIDRRPKFGVACRSAETGWISMKTDVDAVLQVSDIAGMVMSYLTIDTYNIFDVADAIDQYGTVFPVVVLDRWPVDGSAADWFLIRFYSFGYDAASFDIIVRDDAIRPRTIESAATPRSTVLKSRFIPMDDRWPAFAVLPFCAVLPDWSTVDDFERHRHRLKAIGATWIVG